MNVFRNLSIRTKLGLLTVFLLLLMFGNSMLNRQTLNQVKVTGPIYSEVVSGKDLVADILPPPAYIIEAYLTSIELSETTDAAESDRLIRKLQDHKTAFQQRIDHWTTALPTGELKDSLLGEAKSTADEYFQLAEEKFLPVVREQKLEEARQLVRGSLKSKYQQHHEAITNVVRLADEHNQKLEASTVTTLSASSWWTNATAIIVSSLIAVVVWMTSRNATRRIAATRELAKALAVGNFSRRFNAVGGDEIDQMGSELSGASQTLEGAISAIVDSMEAAAKQDYTQSLAHELPGELNRCREALNTMLDKLAALETQNHDNIERERAQADAQKQKVDKVLVAVNAVAEGKFDITIPDLGDDAVGQVAKALTSAVSSIGKALLEVRGVSETVASAACQMSAASTEISRGAQNQASSMEETATSLEEITSTVKQNTDNAQQARQLANGSRDVAEHGGAVVGEAVKAMGEINQASARISDIISTIDEIAFQTNLLALNAAVEAARAGEQGRGFAVVASEVRNLAQRSALAAKEIKTLIQDSVRKVENGTSLVNQSGKTLEEIVNSVKRVTDIVAEIAAASREQLTGIEQVNKAVAQMDRVTQSNASQTEEMAGTSESLSANSQQLRELVSQFQLEASVTSAASNSRRRAESSRSNSRPIETDIEKVAGKLEQMAGAGFVEF